MLGRFYQLGVYVNFWCVRESGVQGGYKKRVGVGGWSTKDEELHATVVAQRPLDPHFSTLTKSPTTMFRKLFVPVFFLLAFAVHSALGVITSMNGPGLAPNHVIQPGDTFTVTFHTDRPRDEEFYVAFGLNPGLAPPPGKSLGATVLTSPESDLVASGHERTGNGQFKVHLKLPKNFSTGSKTKKRYTLTAAVFRVVSWVAAAMDPLIWLGFAHSILFCMCRLVDLGLGCTQRVWMSSMTVSSSSLNFAKSCMGVLSCDWEVIKKDIVMITVFVF